MRKSEPITFGQLWDEFVEKTPGVATRLAEARITEIWPGMVGAYTAYRTESVKISKGILYVKMSSASARHEIFMKRAELGTAVNKALGMNIVRNVIVK